MDDLARVLAVAGRLHAGGRGLGVRVGVERQHLVPDEVLDEGEGTARRGVVGVGDAARTIGAHQHLIVADDRHPDGLDQPVIHGHGLAPWAATISVCAQKWV
jgi:hypothetical protein